MMRFVLKLFAAPIALALTIAAALFSFVLAMSNLVFGIVSGLAFLVSVGLFLTDQTTGGIAFLVIAFLVSPAGIPALAGWLVKGLGGAGSALKGFIFS